MYLIIRTSPTAPAPCLAPKAGGSVGFWNNTQNVLFRLEFHFSDLMLFRYYIYSCVAHPCVKVDVGWGRSDRERARPGPGNGPDPGNGPG